MRTLRFFVSITMLLIIGHPVVHDAAHAAGKVTARQWQGQLPVRGPWLRDRLPEGVLAYHRIPHLLGFVATPKGSVLDPALRSDVNVRALQDIWAGISENVLTALPMFEDVRLRFFAERIRSPIEIAAFSLPAPSAMIAMNLDLASAEQFQDLIEEFSYGEPPLELAAPLDERGFGQILGLPAPMFLQFDETNGRLLLQSGPAVTYESFVEITNAITPNPNHPMLAMESRIDESGHGWFAWLDTANTLSMAQMFLPPDLWNNLTSMGLDQVRTVGLGWGVADQKGRLSLVLDVSSEGNRQLLPFVSNNPSATSVGEPDALALLSVPTAEEFSRLEALILETVSEEQAAHWFEGKAAIEEKIGISIEEILAALGPELLFILDSVGDYAAIRVRDRRLFDQLIDDLSEATGSAPDSKRINRTTFHHWIMAAGPPEDLDDAEELDDLALLLLRLDDHIYWTHDGEFLYLASIPQPLIERSRHRRKTDVAAWLSDPQHLDVSSSVIAITGSSSKMPMRLYHTYLEVLQTLADISETSIDMWSMPTVSQLALPAKGALGFSINLGDPYLSMELMFENNPGELLFGQGMQAVAVIGIIAAIAIPAYQDYTIRARVSEGLNYGSASRAAIAEYFDTKGRFPGPSDAAALSSIDVGEHVYSITVLPDNGIIVVQFTEDAIPTEGELYLEPIIEDDGSISWTCSGTLGDKYLPATCRGNEPPEAVSEGA